MAIYKSSASLERNERLRVLINLCEFFDGGSALLPRALKMRTSFEGCTEARLNTPLIEVSMQRRRGSIAVGREGWRIALPGAMDIRLTGSSRMKELTTARRAKSNQIGDDL
jgi:hypothetical protein